MIHPAPGIVYHASKSGESQNSPKHLSAPPPPTKPLGAPRQRYPPSRYAFNARYSQTTDVLVPRCFGDDDLTSVN
ncbi:unnamed protein product [Acanthoscelides obtectus]|uniref:Uncharacterized protein n=1 Tax=Acanthoscelides obtectus TaxID=200917 RepID=A0A9P0KKV8_ACAOB|nr:unnamed protein product [Acanthoscelides obtectus]CAK1646365.1 hypothetical protein AOBTE_LOCUS14601 [Acanthoscelides obtectus]